MNRFEVSGAEVHMPALVKVAYFLNKYCGYNSMNDEDAGGSIWEKQKRLS